MKMIHSSKIHPEVKTLLSYATSEKKVEKEYSLYIACPERVLYGYTFAHVTIGCIGIVKREANQCEIIHIAVSPAYRGKGIGREMIRYVETDQEAVLFYKNIGFHITSLGEKYPGVERFGCLLTCTT